MQNFEEEVPLNQAFYWQNEAALQVTETREQMCYREGLLQNNTAPPAGWDMLTQPDKNTEQLQQEAISQMLLNPGYHWPNEAAFQVTETREQMCYMEETLQNHTALPAYWYTLTQPDKNPERFQQEADSQMLLNSAYYWPNEAATQATATRKEMTYTEGLLQNYTATPANWDTLTQPDENPEQFVQAAEQSMNHLYYLSNPLSMMPLNNRREKNRKREKRRQQHLKEGFNVLRNVIPDYFSEREPGERLTRIKTLNLATKYIALLRQMLETS